MYTFSPMMVANSRKHHCRVRPYTREVLVLSTNLEIQTKHYSLVFRNRRGDEARIKKTWFDVGYKLLLALMDDVGCYVANDCDAFDSDVDEAPTAQNMFMANLSSADLVYDEASPSYDSDILYKASYPAKAETRGVNKNGYHHNTMVSRIEKH
ncbi:hypothetical protein Tco_0711931 [Tanacetum coccineum]